MDRYLDLPMGHDDRKPLGRIHPVPRNSRARRCADALSPGIAVLSVGVALCRFTASAFALCGRYLDGTSPPFAMDVPVGHRARCTDAPRPGLRHQRSVYHGSPLALCGLALTGSF